jgi:hypothetical protein
MSTTATESRPAPDLTGAAAVPALGGDGVTGVVGALRAAWLLTRLRTRR